MFLLIYNKVVPLCCTVPACVLGACREQTFDVITIKRRAAHLGCQHCPRQRNRGLNPVFAILWRSCLSCKRSEVSRCVRSTSERHRRIGCLSFVCAGTLWQFVTQSTSHRKMISFVAWCITSWLEAEKDGVFVFSLAPAWMFKWVSSKDQRARRIGGSELVDVWIQASWCLWTVWQTSEAAPTKKWAIASERSRKSSCKAHIPEDCCVSVWCLRDHWGEPEPLIAQLWSTLSDKESKKTEPYFSLDSDLLSQMLTLFDTLFAAFLPTFLFHICTWKRREVCSTHFKQK